MKRFTGLMTFLLPLILSAQSGIRWTDGLSWEEVKVKARQEHKYIFLDCYTTWCAPCKQMDQSTYLNDSVGEYFNEHFISVKVQMDQTEKDGEKVKKWYADADSIAKKYHVEGYPSFIFFNPAGEIVHKAMSYRAAGEFIAVGRAATVPDKVYDDEYVHYDNFVRAYKDGERDYDRYPAMMKIALKLSDNSMFLALSKELNDYLLTLPHKSRYTKERVEVWSSVNLSSKSRTFNFFYKDSRYIDKVMGHKGYASEIVDKTIQEEICIPFMEEQAKLTGIAMKGMYLSGDALKTDSAEADWKKLHKIVKEKYGKSYADRSVLTARVEWYARHRNKLPFLRYSLLQLKKYPPDLNIPGWWLNRINGIAWETFLYSNDKAVLKACIPWMEKVIQRMPNFSPFNDTYANLLYKLGRKEEAIEWQQKAVALEPENEVQHIALEKMKRDEPTYVEFGAIWNNTK